MERIGRRASYVEEEEKLRLSEPPLSPLLPPSLPWHGMEDLAIQWFYNSKNHEVSSLYSMMYSMTIAPHQRRPWPKLGTTEKEGEH